MTTHPSTVLGRQAGGERDKWVSGPTASPEGGGAIPAGRPSGFTTHPSAALGHQAQGERDKRASAPTVDIFCRVVDNYGDIGVCWRLARRLGLELGRSTRLWVDDLQPFARLEPTVVPTLPRQTVSGIEVRLWEQDPADWPEPAALVIEAFACELPAAFRARLQPQHTWINLEYLSAEDWVESCHGLPSPQAGGLVKRFLFPGFTVNTGGLLRETGLLAQRDAWQADLARQEAFLHELGVAAPLAAEVRLGHRRLVSAFCYPHAPLGALLDGLAGAGQPLLVLLAGGADPGPRQDQAAIVLHRIPFLRQDDYDRLLWSADLNLVRGEDSFVRAQLAGRPLLWHIYPQDDNAHQLKLEAWLAKAGPPPDLAQLHRRWNQVPAVNGAACQAPGPAAASARGTWPVPASAASWQSWRHWAQAWGGALYRLPELAEAVLAAPPGP